MSANAIVLSDVLVELLPAVRVAHTESHVGKFERLPKWLNCIPLVMQWFWLGFIYRSVTLPSSANPSITSGGLVGEGKLEYFECMGGFAKSKTANYASILVEGNSPISKALDAMQQQHLHFPIIVKPNLGWCGYGVRLVHDADELASYIAVFPKGETIILQQYLPEEGEAGIFYARYPDAPQGKVIGMLLRYFPQVIGDGVHSIQELIEHDERLKRIENNALHEAAYDPRYIPATGEKVRLATIGSTRIGGKYCDGSHVVSATLAAEIDKIAMDMRDFHVGRFDVRFENMEQLNQGKFTIIEVNGSGSEAVHGWDPKYSIRDAYRIIFAKQRLLFSISHANRKKGHKPIGILALTKLHLKQQWLIKHYPLSN